MIKKILHTFCVLSFGSVFCVGLWLVYALIFYFVYGIDILSAQTYSRFSDFWNGGGVLNANDTVMVLLLFTYFPLCLFVFYRLSKYKFLNMIIKPYEWLQNRSLRNYREVSVNIKNLKVEDKKTIEQVVHERLEKERGKVKQPNKDELRKNIIEKINQQK